MVVSCAKLVLARAGTSVVLELMLVGGAMRESANCFK
jgi:hypothetical protein